MLCCPMVDMEGPVHFVHFILNCPLLAMSTMKEISKMIEEKDWNAVGYGSLELGL